MSDHDDFEFARWLRSRAKDEKDIGMSTDLSFAAERIETLATRSDTKIVELLREAVSIARSYIAEDGSRPISAAAKQRRHNAVLATLDAALAHIEEEASE